MTNENSHLRVPPHDIKIEQAILGAILIDNKIVNTAMRLLLTDFFYSTKHQNIFNAMINLFQNNEPIDIMTLTNKLKEHSKLEFVGGTFYLSDLTSKVISSANLDYHATIILEKYIARETINKYSTITDKLYSEKGNVFELLNTVQADLFKLYGFNKKKKHPDFKTALRAIINELESLYGKTGIEAMIGLPTGFTRFNEMTGGLQNSDLIILAGRPGQGKTSFALTILEYVAKFTPVAIFSLEMSEKQIIQRLISIVTKINLSKIRNGALMSEIDWSLLPTKVGELYKANIHIDDTPAITFMELRAKAREFKREHGINLLIIDYIQLMREPSAEYREREVSMISAGLKALAKELDIPIIALSQLNRNCENRADKRPILADLRESGSLEQDTDLAVFIHRPEYYGIMQFGDGTPTSNIAEIIIAKARNSTTGDFKLYFDKDRTTFENYIKPNNEPF